MPNIKHTNYIKIQDGCSQHCAYCAIRLFRGASVSERYSDIYNEVYDCVNNRHMQFLQLEGINTVEYYDENIGDIADLCKKLSVEFPNTYFNLMHINPFDIQRVKRVIDVLGESSNLFKTCLFSIQAGCNSVLKRMHRPYNTQKLKELLNYAHEKGIEFTVEVIAGFPGETEEEFMETYNFLDEISPATFYINAFSARPGTEAYNLPNQISDEVISRRVNEYAHLKTKITNRFLKSISGTEILLVNEPHCGLRTIHKIPVINNTTTPIVDNVIHKKVIFEQNSLYIK